ncbi:MAG: polynucleotide adenylyltransferase PcnB [Polyangiaceae bacterium]|nr:polynucleotide adenylyltransferase PcnB [Polyangiaceae bacterium]
MGRPTSHDPTLPAELPEGPTNARGRGRRGRRSSNGATEVVREGDLVARVTVSDAEAPPSSAPPRSRRHPVPPAEHGIDLDDGRLDEDAARVVRRLARLGHEAYLVGGCVRDLLLGATPKDFDVATSARPEEVRRAFRNSRIIGRRFRLVHVVFGGGKVIETATFRRDPHEGEDRSGDDLLIRNDNVFGDANEDAERRDFTINGLFYDVERRCVLDWVDGMPDIERRTVRTIGDPVKRFREDPVRVLRAIKFSARLDCAIHPDVYDAMVLCRGALAMAARPRVFEELLRLMRGGASHRSMWLAWELGVLDILLPELAAWLSDQAEDDSSFWRALDTVDRITLEQGPLDDTVLLAVLLHGPIREGCSGARDRIEAAREAFEPIVERLNVPRRIVDGIARIEAALPKLTAGAGSRFARSPLGAAASQVREAWEGEPPEAEVDEAEVESEAASEPDASGEPLVARRKRRRRPRRRPGAAAPPA